MMDDPWSRPTVDELRRVLESIGRAAEGNQRQTERLELSVPAEVTTSRGNTVAAMTREISRFGIGLLHRGAIAPGEVVVQIASDSRQYRYRVALEWCRPCENGLFLSGGRFLEKLECTEKIGEGRASFSGRSLLSSSELAAFPALLDHP